MTDPDLLFTAKIRNLTENELVVFFVCSVFYPNFTFLGVKLGVCFIIC